MTRDQVYKKIEEHYLKNFQAKLAFAKRFFPNVSDAEDAVQEAYLRALEYWKTYDPDKAEFDSWFNTIMMRNSIRKTISFYKNKGLTWTPKSGVLQFVDLEEAERNESMAGLSGVKYKEEVETLIAKESAHNQFVLTCFFVHLLPMKELLEISNFKKSRTYKIIRDFREKLSRKLLT